MITSGWRTGSRAVAAALVGTLAIVQVAAYAGPVPADKPGAESPQALVERLAKAGEAKDFGEIVNCMDPAGRTEMTAGMLAVVTMMIAFMDMGPEMMGGMAEGVAEGMSGEELSADQQAEIDKGKAEAAKKSAELKQTFAAVLKKHGMPDLMDPNVQFPEGEAKDELFAKLDHGAFVTDLMGVMEALGEGQPEGEEEEGLPMPVPNALEVKNYRVEGDHATAEAAGGETLDFVKVDGRWYLSMPEQQAPPQPSPQE